jgi:predicted dehydrogenase
MKLGAAVVGLGVGEAHARAYQQLPSCELRWVVDLDGARAEAAAATYKCRAATSFQAALEDPAVHIVSLASYDDAHAEQAIAALERGKHVFVEKPLARTPPELAAVKQAWRRGGSHLASNLILRAAPLYARVREMIGSGELGDIFAFDGDYLYGRIEKITEGWRGGVADYSVIEGGGIHLVDLMVWLTGQRPSRVAAVGNRIATRGSAFRYNDYVAAISQFSSGLIGRITANFGCVHRHHHVVRIFGTRATFIYDDRGARLHTSRDPGANAVAIEAAPLAASKGDLVPAFVSGILRGERDAAATQTHFDVLCACAAADRAAGTGAFLEIDYV